jgi:hypothetical protein
MVAALRAQPGGAVWSDQLPATLAALVGGGLRACGCLINAAAAPGGMGGCVFILKIEDEGALAAARGVAPAVRPAAGVLAAAHGAPAAPATSQASQERRQPGGAAIARLTKSPGTASSWALRTLLAFPELSALPGPIVSGDRGPGGAFVVPVGALFSAGLRVARDRGWWSGSGGGRGHFARLLRELFGVKTTNKHDAAGGSTASVLVPAAAASVAAWLRGLAEDGAAVDWTLPAADEAPPRAHPAPAADAAASGIGGGQAARALRALLADPAASALPGELVAQMLPEHYSVTLHALLAAGLRAAGLPAPASAASFTMVLSHLSQRLQDVFGVRPVRVRPSAGAKKQVTGLLVPLEQASVAGWLRASAAATAAAAAASPPADSR